MEPTYLVFNGIDGSSGDYLLDPMTPKEVAAVARGEVLDAAHLRQLEIRHLRENEPHYGVVEDVEDPTDLSQAGWGVIFAYGADPRIREALKELLDWRKEQATKKKETYYREFTGADAYRPGESSREFVARHGVAVDQPADPERSVPYYLLIVGDPETIPFIVQYQLDVQYAVGRLHFDTLEEYARYARTVVEAERGRAALGRRAVFFGVQNADDRSTNLSAEQMIKPLGEKIAGKYDKWEVQTLLKDQATKANLAALVGGKDTPALLFTASHGMGFPLGDKRQLPHQGALLCQDWPGPSQWGLKPIPTDHYFAADDVGDEARLLGLMAFHFACYGAGTPRLDDFPNLKLKARPTIAPHAFVARLPQRLLAHPKGGAVAVVGHVERAWGYSFWGERETRQLQSFDGTVQRLLKGEPVGWALEYLNQRYAAVSTELTRALADNKYGKQNDPEVASAWTANNDARSYVVFGDPAARLVVADAGQAVAERPAIEPIVLQSGPALTPPLVVPPPVVPSPISSANVPAGAGAQYGLVDSLQGARDQVGNALRQLAQRFGEAVQQAVEQLASLEVATYVSDNLADVKYENGQFTGGAKLRALSRIKLLGDLLVCVPEKSGEVDKALWDLHVDMVQGAQAHRAEMLKTLGTTAAGLLDALKGL
jgi:hypothetical protein